MSDILRQVDEDLRKERLAKLWKNFGIYIILFIVFIFVSVLGYQLKTNYDNEKNEKLVEIYLKNTDNNNFDEILSQYELIVNSDNEFLSGLAELKKSNLQLEKGNYEDGVLGLKNFIENNKYDPFLKDLAIYFVLLNGINDLEDTIFYSYLTNDKIKNSQFKFLFLEIIAVRKILAGNFLEAEKDFEALMKNIDLPKDIRNRAIKFIELTR